MSGTTLPAPFDLLPGLLAGLIVTVQLTAGAAVVGCVSGTVAGLARLSSRRPIRWIATGYVELFRGTSALVQLFWFYFALPLLGVSVDAMTAAIAVLGLNAGSYGAEVVRGAVKSVPSGQWEAGAALGLSPRQTLRHIVFPQALLAMLPPAGNLLIELLKNTALASMITLSDLTFRAQMLRAETLRTVEVFLLILAIYFALAQILIAVLRRLERSLAHGRDHGGSQP